MAIVGNPQIFNVPDNTAAMTQLGQGGGQLLAALLKYYRSRGGGTYTSPTGATAQISPAEQQLSQMLAQRASQGEGSYTPRRLSFMGEVPVDVAKLLPQLQVKQARGALAKLPVELENLRAETKYKTSQAGYMDTLGSWLKSNPGAQLTVGPDGTLVPIPGTQTTTPNTFAPTEPTKTSTETQLEPTDLKFGQVGSERVGRWAGRKIGERETERGLEASYSAKTAQAAKGFGDTANIAVEERKMILDSFPRDGDSYESRLTIEQSMLGPEGFFESKEKLLTEIINKPTPQILLGMSKNGPRYGVDPTVLAEKKQAVTDLSRLKQTRVLYEQMYEEANKKMPPIGSKLRDLAPEERDIVSDLLGANAP